jgi:hypothetical protein
MTFAKSRMMSAPLIHRTSRRLGPAIAALVLAASGPVGTCHAGGLVLAAPTTIAAAPGSSGSFLVTIDDTDPAGSPGYEVAGDSFELQATGPAGLTFTGVTTATGALPYLFADSVVGMGLAPISIDTFPTADFTAADIGVPSGGYPGYTTLNPGDSYALGLVSYTVDASAAAGSVFTIAFGPNTALADPNGGAVAFAIASVPEPSTWILALIATVVVPLSRRARRQPAEARRPG